MPAPVPSPLLTDLPETGWWLDAERQGGPGPGREAPFPGDWPSLEAIEYVSKLLVLIILVLAFPWLLSKAVTEPKHLPGGALGAASIGG
jgi:hypothetical protein